METALASELAAEGAENIRFLYCAVYFTAHEELFYRLHLRSRIASRLLWIIKTVPAGNPRILFDKARRVQWRHFINPSKPLKIDVICVEGEHARISPSDVGSKLREAIDDHFLHHTGRGLSAGARDAKVTVSALLKKNQCQIRIATQGASLHKRGYRQLGHPATMKENLAAAILRLAGYDGKEHLMDACCGSGTLAIEAAMMALERTPQHLRTAEDFGLSQLTCFNPSLWAHVAKQERQREHSQLDVKIVAADISQSALETARSSARLAGVEPYISFCCCDILEQRPLGSSGLLVANLPYDARLHLAEMATFYRNIGDRLKQHFRGWRAALVVGEGSPWKQFGLHRQSTHCLVNGTLAIRLVIFDLKI
jgi:putative N6-adenine-specific DNA methylase